MTPLHRIGDFLRHALGEIPIPLVRILFVGSFIVLLIWVLLLPRSATTAPNGSGRAGDNLKTGAVVTLVIQILIYSIL
ncbi:MAG: hypothetical protein R3C19_01425 [Planctomycetaceae bacterium]